MAEKDKSWLPNFRQIPVDEVVRQVISQGIIPYLAAALGIGGLAGFATYIASIFGRVPDLTSVGWLTVFFGSSLAIVCSWAVYEWASLARLRKKLSPNTQIDQIAEPSQGHISNEIVSSPFVSFEFVGNWENGPLRLTHLSTPGHLPEALAEDLYLRIKAKSNLKNASLLIKLSQGNDLCTEVSIDKSFSGDVAIGMEQSILIYRHRFEQVFFIYTDVSNNTQDRLTAKRTLEKSFFPLLNEKYDCTKAPAVPFHISIQLFHENGPELASFSMTTSVAVRPDTSVFQRTENIVISWER